MIINILPDSYKEDIRKTYRFRRLIVFLAALGAVAFIGAVALVPPYVLLTTKQKNSDSELFIIKKANTQRLGEDADSIIKTVNTQSSFLLTTDIPFFADDGLIERVLSYQRTGITLTGMFYDGKENVKSGEGTLLYRIRGIADSRASLSSFIEILRGDSFFEKVDVPISQFAREQNIPFSITLVARIIK